MKNKRRTFMLALIILIPLGLMAQKTIKIGHIDSQKLMQSMPEYDSAQVSLQRIAENYQKTLEELQVELNTKFEKYQKELETMTPLIRSTKETELNEMNERIQSFQAQAQQDIEKQRMDLFQPIQEKAKKAVDEVAAENNFSYIFDIGPGVGAIVYSAPDTEDILVLVKQKLGLK